MIKEFWVVTVNGGLYHVYFVGDSPVAKKVDQVSYLRSEVPVGEVLKGGYYIGITKTLGLVKYRAEFRRNFRSTAFATNTSYWGAGTSAIVGLFTKEEEARACFAGNPPIGQWDWRYQSRTIETLVFIGRDHPSIVIDEPVLEMLDATLPQLATSP